MGRQVIDTEAQAIAALAHELDDSFVDAVRMLGGARGRIIVCGLGKSGQIAAKIASTLMATGMPAQFLHAAEAVHGDLGMLVTGDVLLILSNSGDTREFRVIAEHATRLGVPIVAITSALTSFVAAAAKACLLLPAADEACPFGSSPTTSTAMMLALGDALAITLMRLRGISAESLQRLHPGGRIGLDIVTVDSFMHTGEVLPLVTGDMPMPDVLDLIGAKRFGVAGVIDDERRLCGVITDGDIRRHAATLAHTTAAAVMTRGARTLHEGAMARDALAILAESRITSLFVLARSGGGRVAGLVHVHDLLRLGIG